MSLKDVMDDYFRGVKTENKLTVRELINHPKNMEEVNKKARAFPIINKMLIQYYRNLWLK